MFSLPALILCPGSFWVGPQVNLGCAITAYLTSHRPEWAWAVFGLVHPIDTSRFLMLRLYRFNLFRNGTCTANNVILWIYSLDEATKGCSSNMPFVPLNINWFRSWDKLMTFSVKVLVNLCQINDNILFALFHCLTLLWSIHVFVTKLFLLYLITCINYFRVLQM